ncbi:MAG TPA: chemotaxis protein CheA [Candidatus Limnocylindria bacterium]|nr:chemotaxis protein CheA [Candidatus Limnocylindria bacterium]
MTDISSDPIMALTRLTEKVALELVYAEVGKDAGLLPLNCLIGEIEERGLALTLPEVMKQAMTAARGWIDHVFESSGSFDAPTLQRLADWSQWMLAALLAVESGHPLPEVTTGFLAAPDPAAPVAPAVAVAEGSDSDEPIRLNLENDGELLREFINESYEHLQNIEGGVLTLEENPTDAETLNSIFRAFHTFKGGSGFLNLQPVNHLAHELESLLDLARQHKLTITSEIINLILAGRDSLKRFVTEIELQLTGQKPLAPISFPIQHLISRVLLVTSGSPSVGLVPASALSPASIVAPAPTFAPVSIPAPAAALPLAATRETPAGLGVAAESAPSNPPEPQVLKNTTGALSVKVDTSKLDSLVDLVGEMVIAQSLVAQDPHLKRDQNQQLARNLAQLGRISKELQRAAMSLRMVPIRSTFQKMTRLVRDLSAKESKQIQLVLSGEDTELDRTIVEEISDPLVHMVRNSVDHGVERADIRLGRNKPAQGTIHLRACHQGGSIVIQIEDDGGGLNRERILAKAIQQGLVPADAQLPEGEIYKLIFQPGFSTAEKITSISGRGVGMDVVRRNIEKLHGRIEITSTLGVGSCFTIYLPLTLAIIDGLLISVGRERYILPTLSVRESFRPTPEMLSSLNESSEMVMVRGRLIPLLRLADHFEVPGAISDPAQALVVVVESNGQARCLLVDHLLGKQEVVIKSLGETFKHARSLAGAAILGDGKVGLILNVDALVRLETDRLQLAA